MIEVYSWPTTDGRDAHVVLNPRKPARIPDARCLGYAAAA